MLFHSLEAVGRAVMLAAEVQEANSEEREDQAAFSVDQPLAEPQEPHSEAMEAGGPWAAARATRAEAAAAMDFIVMVVGACAGSDMVCGIRRCKPEKERRGRQRRRIYQTLLSPPNLL